MEEQAVMGRGRQPPGEDGYGYGSGNGFVSLSVGDWHPLHQKAWSVNSHHFTHQYQRQWIPTAYIHHTCE